MGAINRTNIAEHLIRKQLEMVGKTWEEAQKDDMWFFNWTMTQEQADMFKAYAIPLIKKVFKCNRSRAEHTFSWFFLEFGLRVIDEN
jgi:beta-xylosidase